MSAVTIFGNVATEIELKVLPTGAAVVNFLVISSTRRKNSQTDEWEDIDKTAWNIKCWKQLAENVAEHITKGSPVVLSGDAVEERWETSSGEKRSRICVTAQHIGIDLSRNTAKKSDGASAWGSSGASAWDSNIGAKASDPWAKSAVEEIPPF